MTYVVRQLPSPSHNFLLHLQLTLELYLHTLYMKPYSSALVFAQKNTLNLTKSLEWIYCLFKEQPLQKYKKHLEFIKTDSVLVLVFIKTAAWWESNLMEKQQKICKYRFEEMQMLCKTMLTKALLNLLNIPQ